MDTAAAAVFGDLQGCAVKPNVQAKEEGRERKGIWPGKSSKSETVQRSKQTTNLRERISSGRVIESENQSAHPRSDFHFVLSIFSLSSPAVSPFQSYHFTPSLSSLQPPGSHRESLFPLGLHLSLQGNCLFGSFPEGELGNGQRP